MPTRRNRVASSVFSVALQAAVGRGVPPRRGGVGTRRPGIILVARLLVSRAGGLPSPRSPTYQQAETKMKSERENFRCFLLLLFLFRRAETVEIRHGTVVAYDLRTRPCSRPLAHGHFGRLGASASPSRRVHHSLTCRSAKLAVERTGNDLATRVGAPRVHQRGADSPMPERMVII